MNRRARREQARIARRADTLHARGHVITHVEEFAAHFTRPNGGARLERARAGRGSQPVCPGCRAKATA